MAFRRRRRRVDAFHQAASTPATPTTAPGRAAAYHPGYYGAYVLDPDRDNVEVVNHHR